eukprot:161265-Lingulodinium_polyedra.AAC.1
MDVSIIEVSVASKRRRLFVDVAISTAKVRSSRSDVVAIAAYILGVPPAKYDEYAAAVASQTRPGRGSSPRPSGTGG